MQTEEWTQQSWYKSHLNEVVVVALRTERLPLQKNGDIHVRPHSEIPT